MLLSVLALATLASQASAHYTFPNLIVNGAKTPDWVNVRRTNNYQTQAPVTDVTSADFRCYNSQGAASATTVSVAAGATLGIACDQTIYHPGVLNVYMARAPSSTPVAAWDGAGPVWFKVHQLSAQTNGGQSIAWPAQNLPSVSFTVPRALPSGQYLVRVEAIALHVAQTFGGAQFYISCGQVQVTGGGSGTPGPLVSIPGVYTGHEPGILININWPIPVNYTQPGPAVWSG
ncbi:glycoside hydrolase family 61 protein [Epithele typhae]|uniref:glycoside hydrolase family 61 protein n=1 Tax=Epithele typhae TaxID=378194 RepID=UPI002008475F|nr:glycoside hydrolase family 61 protein [Epithele typhae]KAH9915150.1 glycoside hydrolase family 61 protein [Epithele typhae]